MSTGARVGGKPGSAARYRARLEQHQVWIYLAAVVVGLGVARFVPSAGQALGPLLWPLIAALLYTTFVLVPLRRIQSAFADVRFLVASVAGNFMLVPLVVWLLLGLLPADPAIRLGVMLVLLVPCTDWFISFAHRGGGDVRRAIAVTPLNLLLQMILLPIYIAVFDPGVVSDLDTQRSHLVLALVTLIMLPMAAAVWTQYRIEAKADRSRLLSDRFGLMSIPLLALVILSISASHSGPVFEHLAALGSVAMVFVLYLIAAVVLARVLGGLASLDTPATRTLAYMLGTRNSFVVLPIAVALPVGMELAAVVIVLQSLIELLGMIVYLAILPRLKLSAHD